MKLSKTKKIKLLDKMIDRIEREEMKTARCEHAWLLVAEGLSHKEISTRLGCTEMHVRSMVNQFGVRVSHAMGSYHEASLLRMVR